MLIVSRNADDEEGRGRARAAERRAEPFGARPTGYAWVTDVLARPLRRCVWLLREAAHLGRSAPPAGGINPGFTVAGESGRSVAVVSMDRNSSHDASPSTKAASAFARDQGAGPRSRAPGGRYQPISQ